MKKWREARELIPADLKFKRHLFQKINTTVIILKQY